jgi:hypothetical protein
MSLQGFPFQEASNMNPSGINYNTLKAAAALKHLQEMESMHAPTN